MVFAASCLPGRRLQAEDAAAQQAPVARGGGGQGKK
jgi:hypothetical protein